jgi:hypothetical protein
VEKSLKELREKGLLIVRYSPKEEKIPWYCGSDAMIRFYKDENEYAGWNGREAKVITVAQSMKDRESACNYKAFLEATEPFERSWTTRTSRKFIGITVSICTRALNQPAIRSISWRR